MPGRESPRGATSAPGPSGDEDAERPRSPRLQAVDALILGTLCVFTALAVAPTGRVPGWLTLAAENVAAGLVYVVAGLACRRIQRRSWRAFARTVLVSLSVAYLFGAVDRLQMLLHDHWLDDLVLAFEERLFGVQPTLWLQRFMHPWLTEWLMFTYVVYIGLYPVVCALIYARAGEGALERCLFTLALVNVLCDFGFVLFPVAGPAAFIGRSYTVSLEGGVFTAAGEFIRSHLHYVGGSLPSPHSAAATVLWAMAWRYHRKFSWALAPIIGSLYVATFYCRYHYVTDSVAGVLTAAIALAAAPALLQLWARRTAGE